jgi:hypothetical protein
MKAFLAKLIYKSMPDLLNQLTYMPLDKSALQM